MISKVLNMAVIALFTFSSNAQVISSTQGKAFKFEVNEKDRWGSLLHMNKIHFTHKTQGISAEIKHVVCLADGSFENEITPKIDMGTFGNSHQLEDVFQFNNKLYGAVDHFSKQDTKHSLLLREVDFTNGNVSENEVELITFAAEKMTNKGDCKFAISPNQSVLAVIGELPFVKEQPCKLKVNIYDNLLTRKSEQEIVLPGENKRYNVLYTYVNNEGVVFIVRVGTYKNGDTQLKIYQVDYKVGSVVKEYIVNVEAPNTIMSYNTAVNPNGELVISGVTNLRQTFSSGEVKANGVFYFYTSKLAEGVTNFTPLDVPIENLVSRKIVFNGNTHFLITEQFKEERKSKNNPNGSMTLDYDYVYTSKSNFVFGFSEDGIKKFYVELARLIGGFNASQHIQTGVFVINNKLSLLYSSDRDRGDAFYQYDPYIINLAQITNDGLLKTPIQIDSKIGLESNFIFYPSLSVLYNSNQIKLLAKSLKTGLAHVIDIKVD
jgi:hypothetical protein